MNLAVEKNLETCEYFSGVEFSMPLNPANRNSEAVEEKSTETQITTSQR